VPVNASSAVGRLIWYYEHPFAQAMDKASEGMPVAGITSNTVPWELLRAAGYFSVMLNPSRGPLPFASQFMEEGVSAPESVESSTASRPAPGRSSKRS
jgi:hypothetical protein